VERRGQQGSDPELLQGGQGVRIHRCSIRRRAAALLQSLTIELSDGSEEYADGWTREAPSPDCLREDFPDVPRCPRCGAEVRELAARRVESTVGVRFLYSCCDCR